MITFFGRTSNKFNEKIVKCNKDIDNIRSFSSILDVVNIDTNTDLNESYNILYTILSYEETLTVNDYSNFTCPNCKRKHTLQFHKTYPRNLIFNVGNYIVTAKINIIVLQCNHCKNNKDQQHFHALLPDFIFPYHIFSENIILNCLDDKFVNNKKVREIESNYRIPFQLLYYWIKIMKKYQMVCGIILKIPIDLTNIIKGILNNKQLFLIMFYQKYFHPFFLFRRTCVDLAITP